MNDGWYLIQSEMLEIDILETLVKSCPFKTELLDE